MLCYGYISVSRLGRVLQKKPPGFYRQQGWQYQNTEQTLKHWVHQSLALTHRLTDSTAVTPGPWRQYLVLSMTKVTKLRYTVTTYNIFQHLLSVNFLQLCNISSHLFLLRYFDKWLHNVEDWKLAVTGSHSKQWTVHTSAKARLTSLAVRDPDRHQNLIICSLARPSPTFP